MRASRAQVLPCTRFSCTPRPLLRAKHPSQYAHSNGFSPVWVRMCIVRLPDSAKVSPHSLHSNGFSPVWVRMCLARCDGSSNDDVQWGQENDFPAPESVLLVLDLDPFPAPESVLLVVLDLDPARALTVTVRWQP